MFRFATLFLFAIALHHFVSTATFLIEMDPLDTDFDFFDSNENDFYDTNLLPYDESNDIGKTLYASQTIGRSHRFYLTAGERKEGDQLLDRVAKQTGWNRKTNAVMNITYPSKGESTMKLNYVFMVVYQESENNAIRIFDGGIGEKKIGITINANDTRYLQYNATFYGVP